MKHSQLLVGLATTEEPDVVYSNTSDDLIQGNQDDIGYIPADIKPDLPVFDINAFEKELYDKSVKKNKRYMLFYDRITAYDIAHGCIRSIVYRQMHTPVDSYVDNFLPVFLDHSLGNAIHSAIQENTSQLTETEVVLKAPSISMSCRLDGLIGDSILVEIKGCNFKDYSNILSSNKARPDDINQTLVYKHLIENYLPEIKNQEPSNGGRLPILDKYKIKKLQFIYVCNEILSNGIEDIGESIQFAKDLKKKLNSKNNQFWFMHTIVIDLEKVNYGFHIDLLKEKIDLVNSYSNQKIIPTMDNKFIRKDKCFFCLYWKICKQSI